MKHESVKLDSPIEIVDIVPLNPLISKCQIKVCYVGDEPNRNGSVITKAVAKEMAKSLPGCPIVGFYNETSGDFEGHNQIIDISNGEWKFKDTTVPYGFVDLNAKVWFQKFADDGVEHEYLMTEGYLWTEQFPEVKRVITKGNNQSMELYEPMLKGFWSEDDKEGLSFFIINEAIISKLCILGEDVEPCFEGSQITKVQFSFEENFQKKLFEMMEQVKEINGEGGTDSVDEEKKNPEMDEEVKPEEENAPAEPEVKFEEASQENKVDNSAAEESSEDDQQENENSEDNIVSYNLEEIQEYIDLKAQYEKLESDFNEMKADYEKLVEFKTEADRKEKQAMIDQFYMLSNEDKKDVIEHIDQYSVDEIEAKLSVICVRNRVSFDDLDKKDDDEENTTTFSLENDGLEDDLTPAWIKAALITKKEMA